MDVPPTPTQLQNDVTTAVDSNTRSSLLTRYSKAAVNDLIRLGLYMDSELLKDERMAIRTEDGRPCHPLKVTSQLYGLRPQAVLPVGEPLEFMVTEIEWRDKIEPNCQHYSRSHMCTNVWYPSREGDSAKWADINVFAVFGITARGESVCVIVRDFKPYIYMECRQNVTQDDINRLKRKLVKKLRMYDDTLIEVDFQMLEHYYGWEPAGLGEDEVKKTKRYPTLKISAPNKRILQKIDEILSGDPDLFGVAGLAEHDLRKDVIQNKFSVQTGVLPYHWVRIDAQDVACSLPDGYATHCQIELDCSASMLKRVVDKTDVPPLLMVSVDGEMFGSTGFPNSELAADCCIGLGLTFRRYGKDEMTRFYLALRCTDYDIPPPACVRPTDILLWFDSEQALLEAYRDLITIHGDADVVITYNGKGFDNMYWEKRMQMLAASSTVMSRFFRLSRFIDDECHAEESGISTAAKGENKYYHVPMTGRVQYDMYRYVKDDYKKMSDNTLKAVCKKLLPKERKNDLSPDQMFNIWRRHLYLYGKKLSLPRFFKGVVMPALKQYRETGQYNVVKFNVGDNSDITKLQSFFANDEDDPSMLVSAHFVEDIMNTTLSSSLALNVDQFEANMLECVKNKFGNSPQQTTANFIVKGAIKMYKNFSCGPDFWKLLVDVMTKKKGFTEKAEQVHWMKEAWDEARRMSFKQLVTPSKLLRDNPHWNVEMKGFNLLMIHDCLTVAIQFHDPSLNIDVSTLQHSLDQLEEEIRQQPEYKNLELKVSSPDRLRKQQKVARSRILREYYPYLSSPIHMNLDEITKVIQHLATLELQLIAKYCIQDCDVVLYLMDYFANVIQDIEMARVTFTSVEKLVTRGQQLKIYSQLMYYGKEWGFMIEDPPPELLKDHGKYEGAIVLDPVSSFYTVPIMILDFMSLYPSIMLQHNLSPNTEVFKDCFKNLPGVTYTKRTLTDGREVVFITHIKGIQPRLLTYLLGERKKAKGEMGRHGTAKKTLMQLKEILVEGIDNVTIDPDLYPTFFKHQQGEIGLIQAIKSCSNFDVLFSGHQCEEFFTSIDELRYTEAADILGPLIKYHKDKEQQGNAKQLSLKISANSIYGFNGVTPYTQAEPNQPRRKNAMLPCIDVAETVTFIGREMIMQTKRLVEEHFGGQVVYGDSVTGDTPILYRLDGKVQYCEISKLPVKGDWFAYHGDKEAALPVDGLEVWSDYGFSEVELVIRHLTDKKLYRITTPSGVVTVTEDHSLLDHLANEVTPNQVKKGDRLLHFPLPSKGDNGNPCSMAFAYGMFYFFGVQSQHEFVIDPVDIADAGQLRQLLQSDGREYVHQGSYDTFYLKHPELHVKYIQDWMSLFFDEDGVRHIPDVMWNADRESKMKFVSVFRDGDYPVYFGEAETLKKLQAAELFWFCQSADIPAAFQKAHTWGEDDIWLSFPKSTPPGDSRRIISKTLVNHTQPHNVSTVYDLQIKNSHHHFSAGVGQLVVHNTDSVMVRFDGITDMHEAFEKGEQVAQFISDSFGNYIILELENVAMPYLLRDKKKQYCKRVWMKPDKPEEDLDIKGINFKKRDCPPFAKSAGYDCLNALMQATPETIDECREKAERVVLDTLERILNNDVPFQDYIMSKSMKNPQSYKSDNVVQLHIHNKRKRRRPGSEPHAGDRVDYVVTIPERESAKSLCQRVEDPEYILEHDKENELDRRYYVDHYYRETIKSIMEWCMQSPKVPDGLFTEFDHYIAPQMVPNNQSQLTNRSRSGDWQKLKYRQPPPSRKITTTVINPELKQSTLSMSGLGAILGLTPRPKPVPIVGKRKRK